MIGESVASNVSSRSTQTPFSYTAYRTVAYRKFAEVIFKEFFRFAIAGRAWQSRRYVFERLGFLGCGRSSRAGGGRCLWIHANSLGEVYAAAALIRRIRERYPRYQIWVSTGNFSADALARQTAGADRVFFTPYDLPWVTQRVVRHIRPSVLLVVEASIWPTLVRSCKAVGVPVVVVSGRLAEGMQFYDQLFAYSSEFFEGIDRFCMQSESQRQRLVAYLSDHRRAVVTGNLKFGRKEVVEAATLRERFRRLLGLTADERLWVVGSLHRGEEGAVFAAFAALRKQDPRVMLAITPRYLEAVSWFETEAVRRGHRVVRRTQLDRQPRRGESVVIVDTYGELPQLYASAAWVFLGNSLVTPGGGQNMIEPALFARPILFGPQMQNFADEAGCFLASGAAMQVADAAALSAQLLALASDERRAVEMGARALALVEQQEDVVERTLGAIATYLEPSAEESSF